jgi:hypothetical protein
MDSSDLDAWLPDPSIRTHHRRSAQVDADTLWRCAQEVRVCDAGLLGRLVRWRIPGTSPQMTFDELFSSYPFTALDSGERHLVAGLAGRIWTLTRDYPRLSGPEEFCAWDEGGTVRVVMANWVEDTGDGTAEIVSEARVKPLGRRAGLRLKTVWPVIARFERLVGAHGLALAARRAEHPG